MVHCGALRIYLSRILPLQSWNAHGTLVVKERPDCVISFLLARPGQHVLVSIATGSGSLVLPVKGFPDNFFVQFGTFLRTNAVAMFLQIFQRVKKNLLVVAFGVFVNGRQRALAPLLGCLMETLWFAVFSVVGQGALVEEHFVSFLQNGESFFKLLELLLLNKQILPYIVWAAILVRPSRRSHIARVQLFEDTLRP